MSMYSVFRASNGDTVLSQTRISTNVQGDNTIVAAVVGKNTRVYSLRLNAVASVTVTVKRGSTSLEAFQLVAGVPVILYLRDNPYYKTAVNEAFVVNLAGAVQVEGMVEYITN